MADLKVRLLGQFQVASKGGTVSNFASDKVRALFAYLTAEVQTPHRREILADLLWPDKPERSARANLRRALSDLRKAVNDDQANPPLLLISRQDIQFNPDSAAWVDVHRLDQLYSLKDANPENISQFEEIFEIYTGDFLAGFSLKDSLPFEEWAIMMREQYARKAITVLKQAGTFLENCGDFSAALAYAWRHVELEPWQEGARRQLMRLLAKTGQRDEALQQYETLANILQQELGIDPELKTQKLFQQIQDGELILTNPGVDQRNKTAVQLPFFIKDEYMEKSSGADVFVARDEQLDMLNQTLGAVLGGQGRVAFIGGEAGSGKSMLLREFVRKSQLAHPTLVSATGYCNAFTGTGDPYLPFREILFQFSGDIETHWKAGAFSREYALHLAQVVPLTCTALIKHGPDLIDRIIPGSTLLAHAHPFSHNQSGWFEDLKEFVAQRQAAQGGGVQQASLLSQFTAVLQEVANENPVVIILDDLQWADAGTLNMLFHLGKNINGSKVMVLGAFRTEEVSLSQEDQRHPLLPIINEFKRDFGDIIINLDEASGLDFVDKFIASEPNELDDEFRRQLFSLTQGHALYTVELLRGLQDTGTLHRSADGLWKAKPDLKIDILPARIEGIIAERTGRLPQKLQHILSLASIEGEFFTAEAIADVEGLQEFELLDLLSDVLDKRHRLVQAHQVVWQNGRTISTYKFRHILFQKYLYSRLDEIELVRFHGQIASALEKLAGEEKARYTVQLARHFDMAKQIEKALEYYIMAAGRAMQMAGYSEAITHFERALELLVTLSESPARDEQELTLQHQLGIARQNILGFAHPKVGKAYKRSWELCQHVGDYRKIMTTQQLLFSYYANMADYDTAFEIMAFLEEDRNLEDPTRQLHANWGYGYMDHILGKQKDCLDRFDKVLTYYNPETKDLVIRSVGLEPGIYGHGWAALYAGLVGNLEDAKEHIRAALAIAESYDFSQFTSDAYFFSSWAILELEDMVAAKEYVHNLLEITAKENYIMFNATARAFLGRILTREGKYREAIESIQSGHQIFQMTGAVTGQSIFLNALAEAYCAAGQVQEGLETIEKYEQFEQKVGEKTYSTARKKIKGDLLVLAGEEDAAEEAYNSSIQAARAESAKLLEIRAATGLARLWKKQGKIFQAQQMLGETYDWFTQGFDTPALVEARQLMDELAHEAEIQN